MKAADTNVLVRVITGDDVDQLADAEAWVAGGVWVSNLVLVELSWVLRSAYRFPKAEVAAALDAILVLQGVVVEEETTVRAALASWRAAGGDVDFADCMILHTAARAGHGPLGTFDAELAKLPSTKRLGGRGRRRPT